MYDTSTTCRCYIADRGEAWDWITEDNVQQLVVLCQRVSLIVADEVDDGRERQRLNEAKLAVLV